MLHLESSKKKPLNFWVSIASFTKRHWFLQLMLIQLSGIWYSLILAFFGQQFGLIFVTETTRSLSFIGWLCTLSLFVILLFFKIAETYTEKHDSVKQRLEMELYATNQNASTFRLLLDSTNSVCNRKFDTLLSEIAKYSTNESSAVDIPEIISNPEQQLKAIADELSACMCSLLKMDKKRCGSDPFVGIIYRCPAENWKWATQSRGLSIEGLLKEESTLSDLLNSKGHRKFYNSKADAAAKKHYIPDNEDEFLSDVDEEDAAAKKSPKGSIACLYFEIRKDDITFVEYVVMVTTYSRKFFEDVDAPDAKTSIENTRENMYDIIETDFLPRIKIEMCLLYLSILKKKRSIELSANSAKL